jgi:hypothetical protein
VTKAIDEPSFVRLPDSSSRRFPSDLLSLPAASVAEAF